MLRPVLVLALAVAVGGCNIKLFKRRVAMEAPEITTKIVECAPDNLVCLGVKTPDEDTPRPQYRAKAPPAGEGFVEGVSAESLDTTSEAEKANALESEATSSETELGRTIASLGDVAEAGFWLKTPLVIAPTEGRVVWADNGNSVNVSLIPKQGEATSGSQISLGAMRALGIPLTALPALIVFAN